jgi:hypothetical protein
MTMDESGTVRSILLDLGLEDLIPLPEAITAPELSEVAGARDLVDVISRALGTLAREDRIRLFRGRWNTEPQRVPVEEGLRLLEDSAWYRFRADDPDEERLYFINVDNLRDT